MEIAIVKYNAGNTQSVIYALERLGINPILTDDPEKLQKADKVIFPGVGEASTTIRHLRGAGLDRVICGLKQPTLGICIGMQLMCAHSEEGDVECLGIFDLEVKKFRTEDPALKIPHMGWNTLRDVKGPLITEQQSGQHAYFVHSFYVPVSDYTIATTDYINPFSAAIQRDNFYAVQFHAEKSAAPGAQILQNFLDLK